MTEDTEAKQRDAQAKGHRSAGGTPGWRGQGLGFHPQHLSVKQGGQACHLARAHRCTEMPMLAGARNPPVPTRAPMPLGTKEGSLTARPVRTARPAAAKS